MAAWWPGLLWCPVPIALLVWAPDDAWALVLRPGGETALGASGGTLAAGARPVGNGVPRGGRWHRPAGRARLPGRVPVCGTWRAAINARTLWALTEGPDGSGP